DGNRGPGNGCRIVGAQECCRRSDLLDLDEFLAWLTLQDDLGDYFVAWDFVYLGLILDLLLHQRSEYVARTDRIARYALACSFQRYRLGEAHQTVLGSDISGFERGGDQTM